MHDMHCHMHVSAADSDGALDDSAARSMHFANALSDLAAGGAVAPAEFSVYGVSQLRGGLFVYAAHPGGPYGGTGAYDRRAWRTALGGTKPGSAELRIREGPADLLRPPLGKRRVKPSPCHRAGCAGGRCGRVSAVDEAVLCWRRRRALRRRRLLSSACCRARLRSHL